MVLWLSKKTFWSSKCTLCFVQWISCSYWLDSYTCSEDSMGLIFFRIQWQCLFTYRYFLWIFPSFFSWEDSSWNTVSCAFRNAVTVVVVVVVVVVGILKVNTWTFCVTQKVLIFWKFPQVSGRGVVFFAPSNTHRSSVWSPYNVEYWRWSKRWWAFNAALIQNLGSWA